MFGPMLLQPLVGWLLDRLWDGTASSDGMRMYAFASYRIGFSLMLAWLVIALISIALTRETKGAQFESR